MSWIAHDTRDQVVDFLRHWSERTELPAKRLLGWAELCPRKFARWQERYGHANLEGRAEQIWKDHDIKLEAARARRQEKRGAQKKLPQAADPACN